MAVRKSGILHSLSDESLNNLEQNLIRYQSIAVKKKAIDQTNTKDSGIYSQNGNVALPSNIVKKQKRGETDRIQHSGILSKFKLKDKTSSSAFQHTTEWRKTQNRIKGIETEQAAFKKMFSNLPGFVGGVASLSSTSGILSSASGLASKIPYVGIIIGIATAAAKAYVAQYGNGGTRDTRVKRLDESSALTFVNHETEIIGGERLFLSNPNVNHGLPAGNSNTEHMRAGAKTHKLRRDGIYH